MKNTLYIEFMQERSKHTLISEKAVEFSKKNNKKKMIFVSLWGGGINLKSDLVAIC